MFSLQKGATHPPKWKSLVGSSSGPPGACMTPSSDWNAAPVSLRIDRLAGSRGLDLGDVDLLHRHHRRKGALGGFLIGIVGRFKEYPRRNLPGEAPFVAAPS